MSGETHNVSRTIEVSIAHVGLDGGVARSITVAFGQLAAQPYWDNIQGKPTFAAVATSGSYNDLTDQPTVLADVRYNSKGMTLQKSADGTEYINIITISDLKHDMDLDNVTNDAQVKASEKGAALGVATLNSSGYIEQSQLLLDEPYGFPMLDGNGHIKQDELQLKTINNMSIKGVGNITIQEGGSADAVLYTKQTLTTEQQETARTNIGAGTSNFSGSYNDLEDKPTIPTVPTNVSAFNNDAGYLTQHQSISGKADKVVQIGETINGNFAGLNSSGNLTNSGYKPSDFATAEQGVLASTAYQKPNKGIPAEDLRPGTIPVVPTISTDISADATSDTKTASPKAVKTFVENKGYGTYSKPVGGIPASDLESGVIPTVPTISTDIATDKASTTKTACPKAVYDEVHPATASSQPAGGMLPNVLYKLGTLSGSVTISLASPTDNTIENEYRFTFTADSTAPTITWPNSITKWIGNSIDNGAPKVEASTYYEVSIQDGYGIFNAY